MCWCLLASLASLVLLALRCVALRFCFFCFFFLGSAWSGQRALASMSELTGLVAIPVSHEGCPVLERRTKNGAECEEKVWESMI